MNTRVPLSKKVRSVMEDRIDSGSEVAIEMAVALGVNHAKVVGIRPLPASVLAPSEMADAIARWAGFNLEIEAEVASYGEDGGVAAGTACMYASLWLRLLAAGAEDRAADASTRATAKQYGSQTWKALTNGEQVKVNRAIGRD